MEASSLVFGILSLTLLSVSLALPVSESDLEKDNESNDIFSDDDILGRIGRHWPFFRKTKFRKPPQRINFKDKKDILIWKYLESYGYVPKTMRKDINDENLKLSMWKYAMWNGAKMSKEIFLNKAIPVFKRGLEKLSRERRCGDPDIGRGGFERIRGRKNRNKSKTEKRYVAQTPWGKNALTYKIESFDNDLSEEVQRQEIAKAFKMWTDSASVLTVSEVQGTATADINIQFVAGSHSDSMPFDGPGFVLAHAFYPEQGQIHFDSDEVYTTGGETNKVNLLSVAAHEIGHALGLGHTSDSNAIMHAQYQPYDANLGLSQDDIDGIQYLYPSNNSGCADEFWCEDILQNECSIFEQYCMKKCGVC